MTGPLGSGDGDREMSKYSMKPKMKDPKIKKTTQVLITRTVVSTRARYEYGPKTISQAIRDNDFTTSSGTVWVRAEVVDGPYAGATVYFDGNGVPRALRVGG